MPLCNLHSSAGNKIGDKGAVSLARGIMQNDKLEQLDLSGNPIGAKGAHAIAHALIVNVTIKDLKLPRIKGMLQLTVDSRLLVPMRRR